MLASKSRLFSESTLALEPVSSASKLQRAMPISEEQNLSEMLSESQGPGSLGFLWRVWVKPKVTLGAKFHKDSGFSENCGEARVPFSGWGPFGHHSWLLSPLIPKQPYKRDQYSGQGIHMTLNMDCDFFLQCYLNFKEKVFNHGPPSYHPMWAVLYDLGVISHTES